MDPEGRRLKQISDNMPVTESLRLCCLPTSSLGACFVTGKSTYCLGTCWCLSAADCRKYLAGGNTSYRMGGAIRGISTSPGSRRAQPLTTHSFAPRSFLERLQTKQATADSR
ncbi:hypothetical protein LX36DRAFT_23322 [Colletotrichum falcatum]|nr:hypothetical protein LX36DRAFT_23322 [Colletotrichum falcatum]